MRNDLLRFCLVLFGISVAAYAGEGKASEADAAWQAVTKLASEPKTKGMVPVPSDIKQMGGLIKLEAQRQGSTWREIASQANKFWTKFPDHPRSNEARKIQIVASIYGATTADILQAEAMLTQGRIYRNSKLNRIEDRIEVAVAMERLQLDLKLRSKAVPNASNEWEKVTDALLIEFEKHPAVLRFCANLLNTVEMSTALRMAEKLLKMDVPSDIKSDAEMVRCRAGLLGKKLGIKLVTIEGAAVDLSSPDGKKTVLFIVSPAHADSTGIERLRRVLVRIPKDSRIVYITVDKTDVKDAILRRLMPQKSMICRMPASTILGALKLKQVPYAVVIGGAGVIEAIAPITELASIFSRPSQ